MAVEFWRCCALLQGEEKTLQEEDNEEQQPSEPKVSQAGRRDHVGFRFRWEWKYIGLASHGESRMNNCICVLFSVTENERFIYIGVRDW